MSEYIIGGVAVSTAGHDTGKCYVIIEIDKEYVYLVDGRIRTFDRPKKKKIKHANMLALLEPNLAEKVRSKSAKNEEIKRALKLLNIQS